MFIKDKAKIANRVSGIKRSVVYSSKLVSVTSEEKFRFRTVRVKRLAVIYFSTFCR